jgi:hypothetical protein
VNLYPILLFLHVTGAICIFVGFGTLLLGTAALRRAKRVEQLRAIAGPMVAGRRVGREHVSVIDVVVIIGVLLVAATGLYMALSTWGGWRTDWIKVAMISFALMAPVGPLVINPRLHALARAADEAPSGPLPEPLFLNTHDPILGTALWTLTAWLLGIVFLMTNKPSLGHSIAAMAVSLAVGLGASGLALWRAERTRLSHTVGRAGQEHQR